MNKTDAKKVDRALHVTGISGVALGASLTATIVCATNLAANDPDADWAKRLIGCAVVLTASAVTVALQMRKNVALTERRKKRQR
jgi:hypothetical protein